ncbi:hypothetical protein [Streptomyces sp. NPDC051569]|uniref:hypothetical protein n=1 Tax=Streptomyces sp. NPDC051569 TaxID=3365661 RepID=UPI0037A0EBB1
MTSTNGPQERSSRRRFPLAALTVAAAVLIAGGSGAYVATSAAGGSGGGTDSRSGGGTPGGDGAPPPLSLDGPAGASAPAPPQGIAPGEPDPHGVTYLSRSELPDGPGSARVYRTNGQVAAAEVTRLARALGVPGTPRVDGTAWKIGPDKDGSGPQLRVERQAPGTWTFARFGTSRGGDDCGKGKGCPAGGGAGGSAPGGEGAAVSEAVAKKAAGPVLTAVGQGDADLDARQLMGAIRVVNADPVVGGLPTYGWSTGIQVGADGQVLGGSGQVKAPERGQVYPVISADEALKELNRSAEPPAGPVGGCATAVPLDGSNAATGTGAAKPAAKPTAPCGAESHAIRRPVEIDRAVFGLALRSVDGRGALVPSWLFEVEPGGDALPYTVTQPAVAPEFLTRPAPPHKESPGTASGRRIASYSTAGRTLTLRFMAGVCGEYTARADESGTAVKVTVTEPAPEPGKVCVAMAKERSATVTLDRPLDGRRVVDGMTGDPVPAS